mgnify:FL=1
MYFSTLMYYICYTKRSNKMAKKINITYDKVKEYLEMNSKYRDDDGLLQARYLFDELKNKGINADEITGTHLLTMLKDKKITNPDAISRYRRAVQENHEHTRGLKYNKRHKHQPVVVAEINSCHS